MGKLLKRGEYSWRATIKNHGMRKSYKNHFGFGNFITITARIQVIMIAKNAKKLKKTYHAMGGFDEQHNDVGFSDHPTA